MKKILFYSLCLLTLASCKDNTPNQEIADLRQRIDSLTQVNVQKDTEIDDMLETLNNVEEGFRAINEAQGRLTVERRGEGANAHARIRENLQFIQQTMNQNKELIEKLQQRLHSSSIASEQLRKVVENLTAQMEIKESELAVLRQELAAKDIHIAELDEQVTKLNEDVTTLKDDKARNEETINNQDKELNTAWYVFGTKRELKEQNILQSGEVLQGNFNKNYFTKIDIRTEKEIKLMSRDAKLLTSHPASSYSLERDADKQYVLHINNPQQFWSTSKYLVVQVK
jgi:chromosome segregation ATPase